MKRNDMLRQLADLIVSQKCSHPLRVGINGIDGAGKTHLADELVKIITDRNVIHVSIDNFHNPRAIRYARGRWSPEGYYYDSFNNQQFIDMLLKPLGLENKMTYQTAAFDHRTNSTVHMPTIKASVDDIFLIEGIFLFRQELQDYWDMKIFIDVPFSEALSRSMERDGDKNEQKNLFEKRYVGGQKIYLEEAKPKDQADIIIDNSDFQNPSIKIMNGHKLPIGSGAVQ